MRNKALYGAYSFWFFISPERGLFVLSQSSFQSYMVEKSHRPFTERVTDCEMSFLVVLQKSRYVHTNVMIYRLSSQNFILLFCTGALIAKLHNISTGCQSSRRDMWIIRFKNAPPFTVWNEPFSCFKHFQSQLSKFLKSFTFNSGWYFLC